MKSGVAAGRLPLLGGLAHDLGLDLPPLEPGVPGDPGIFGPGSTVWRVTRERVLLLGGPAALLMQLAHPLVAAGVADHSGFRRDPFARLRDTLSATLTISFGDRAQAEGAAARVRTTHRRVRGTLRERTGRYPAGAAYDANDPELALWVHATLVEAALDAHDRLVGGLSPLLRAAYYEDSKPFGELFGVTPDVMPGTYSAFTAYVQDMLSSDALAVGSVGAELGEVVLNPPVAAPVRPARWAVRILTAGLLPGSLRGAFDLPWGPAERAAFLSFTRASRAALPAVPPRLRYWPHARVAERRVAGSRGN